MRGRLGRRSAGSKSEPVAYDHAQGSGIRTPSASWQQRKVPWCDCGNPSRHAGLVALSQGGARRYDCFVGRRVVYVHLPITPNLREPHVISAKSGTPSGRSKNKNKKDVQRVTTNDNGVLRHRVKQGETLYSIASSYKTTVAALKRDNG